MKRYIAKPNTRINLDQWKPDSTAGFNGSKETAENLLPAIIAELEKLQELLYAEQKHKLLIVLQAMDTGGKDGTIRKVFEGVNPQGVRVASFKQPSVEEAAHDYLWRVHHEVPRKGEIVIFNRSHYEDVLVTRVHRLVPRECIDRRYAQINDFERMLTEEGTTILKFFLHISKEEQKKRIENRLEEHEKSWKFSESDITERGCWHQYTNAYEAVLSKTSTRYAPWYIVPANHKWFRNYFVASEIVKTLESLKMKYPRPIKGITRLKV
jgi:PPK2 family polyphosphate:nucleotide phosphotransferase